MKSRDRVALFLPSLMPGGVQRMMLNLAGGLVKHGLRVDLLLVQSMGPFLQQVPGNVRVFELDGRRALTSLPELVTYMRKERPHSLLAAQTHCNIVALWARTMSGVPLRLIVSEHGYISSSSGTGSHPLDRIMPVMARMFYRQADGVVAVSSQAADDLAGIIHLPREKVTVIHNPVVPDDLEEMIKPAPPHPWFHAAHVPVLLAVGRLYQEKDYPTLLRAFALLRAKRRARLLILGEGEKRAELENLASSLQITNDISLPGFAANPFSYMARCAAFVLSSTWEGFGNVLVEALACGAQVVSTRCPGGPAEILAEGKYGRLVPPGEPSLLAAAIASAMDEPISPDLLRGRADDFSIRAILPRYLEILRL